MLIANEEQAVTVDKPGDIGKINVILIAEDMDKLKVIAKSHGITYLMLLKILIANYNEELDKIEQIDTKGKATFVRACLALGDSLNGLNDIAQSHNVNATAALRSIIREFVSESRAPREYIIEI